MLRARELLDHFRGPGELQSIGIRPGRELPMRSVAEATLVEGRGVIGDRYAAEGRGGNRQVSLLQAEHLAVIGALVGSDVDPLILRRNLVIRGINLQALRSARFRIGPVLLEGSGDCDPCSKMEVALGRGGYNAMRGHGGILARVIEGGIVRQGDAVRFAGSPLPCDALGAPLRRQTLPLCPELQLYVVDANIDLERPVQAAFHTEPLPFWAFCWGAGAALARHVLDHPELVRGARVVDFGSGSGIAAIAAAKAGARDVIAVDLDDRARAACAANAALNAVDLVTATTLPDDFDVLLAADVLYEGASNLQMLRALCQAGRRILLGVPERQGVTAVPWSPIARIEATTFPDVDTPTRHVRLYALGEIETRPRS